MSSPAPAPREVDVRSLVVVPAFNEELALPGTLAELAATHPALDVVVVDDASGDATAAVAARSGAVVVRLPYNLGPGGAVRTGLRYAEHHDYDRVVVVDADGQHDPAAIDALLAALDGGADMAVGSRFAPGAAPYAVGRSRRTAMHALEWMVRRISGRRLTDVTSGFRAFDRPVLHLLAREYPADYIADTVEALLIVLAAGHSVVEVPVDMRRRTAGVPSTRSLRLPVTYLRALVGIGSASWRYARPLKKDKKESP